MDSDFEKMSNVARLEFTPHMLGVTPSYSPTPTLPTPC